jgi:hypothetical protein
MLVTTGWKLNKMSNDKKLDDAVFYIIQNSGLDIKDTLELLQVLQKIYANRSIAEFQPKTIEEVTGKDYGQIRLSTK